MEGFKKLFDELNLRVALLEKQMSHLIDHYVSLEVVAEKNRLNIKTLEGENRARTSIAV